MWQQSNILYMNILILCAWFVLLRHALNINASLSDISLINLSSGTDKGY